MKKFVICILVLMIGLTLYGVNSSVERVDTEYLRIHIRANSNLEQDQNVKYKVKEKVVEYLTPIVSSVTSKEDAKQKLKQEIINIESVANKTLIENGFTYTCKAQVLNEQFPTRSYENLTLESGFYDALILELGTGDGDNWWCVVYPPLCFTGEGTNYIYKSKIKEIIDNFYKNRG